MRKGKIAKNVDEYLAAVPPDQRAALERLRKIIRTAAPKATEVISYGMPGYKYHGMLVYFAAFKNHCSFFPGSGGLERYGSELAGYQTSKGTIRFTLDKPLPATLVRKLVKVRAAENEARAKKKLLKKR